MCAHAGQTFLVVSFKTWGTLAGCTYKCTVHAPREVRWKAAAAAVVVVVVVVVLVVGMRTARVSVPSTLYSSSALHCSA
jgi:hypothetical protein